MYEWPLQFNKSEMTRKEEQRWKVNMLIILIQLSFIIDYSINWWLWVIFLVSVCRAIVCLFMIYAKW